MSVLVQARATSLEDFLEGMASGTRRLRASWTRASGYAAPDLLRNPWAIGGEDSHLSLVTYAGILTSGSSTTGLRRCFAGAGTLSYRAIKDRTRSFGD